MIKLKTPEEIRLLKEGGKILAQILHELEIFTKENYQKENFSASSIDKKAEELLRSFSVKPSFKDYSPGDFVKPYPANVCVSINNEVVHGIPGNRRLENGDLVSLDLGVIYKKLYTDAAISFVLGEGGRDDIKMVEVVKKALYKGIKEAVPGKSIGDIGHAIEEYVLDNGFGLVRDYCGHGVGYSVHEEPSVPNCGKIGDGEKLREGMIIAIEPMIVSGDGRVYVGKNGWTVLTSDGGHAAHWEHTIAVTKDGPIILTETD